MFSLDPGAQLERFVHLLCQPPNRWEGFALNPAEGDEQLRLQILFSGWALAALATQPAVNAEQQQHILAGVGSAVDRLVQRRVWASWATTIEREGLHPDPVGTGNAAYAGALATLLGLSAVHGAPLYTSDPLLLHWSATSRFSYTHTRLVTTLATQMRADASGAIPCGPDRARASSMALVLWGLRLFDTANGTDHALAGTNWLQTFEERMALRGPRLPGRGALAGSYSPRQRRAALASNPSEDALALALMAPLAPELVARLATRHWPAAERQPASVRAFSTLLAVELGEPDRASQLQASLEMPADAAGLISEAVLTIAACGGLHAGLLPALPQAATLAPVT